MNWHIGCSGFYYRHWKGLFYPEDMPQRMWFDYYCQHFSTLELNGSFNSFPKIRSLKNWYLSNPMEFNFAVKAHRTITHFRQFQNTKDIVNDFYQVVSDGLQEKLGAVLFQMPPKFTYSLARLDSILNNLNPLFNNVVEFRHISWWQPDVYTELAKHNISFCGMSHPALPADIVANTPTLYYRLHGNQQFYHSAYTEKELAEFANKALDTRAQKAYIYFNNDIGASAVYNATDLIRLASSMQISNKSITPI
ncbi:DUF72 domain-containing protein [Mucilaginibacter sp. CSA2-8R]|uniref:DUF72 domain-containing protein n=1 Tax=Mucilaginibacter sp. CSA2-8R TaxID=3141542 RepID=UPI00315D6A26